ncbi:pentapeptide repeat-containing protein [Paenarthrobacter nitroguajacolicus]|uniref:pentapeptide repeat-containing protein n=1 Tax=Paenarthrobacter nitroguajacolicus TaxID=211146 RepID=UPI0015BF082B|nr:pentapeptide repeat-containing protein [Paenarthrobacter nitroguajacolicus]
MVSGSIVAVLSVFVQVHFDDVRSDKEARQENLRFVRDRSGLEQTLRPFATLDLAGQSLAGLHLEEANFRDADLSEVSAEQGVFSSSQFKDANLSKANFFGAHMAGSELTKADLSKGRFYQTDLKNARLGFANVDGADFVTANLSGADFRVENIDKAKLVGEANTTVCYDSTTKWPDGFQPPPMNSGDCEWIWTDTR